MHKSIECISTTLEGEEGCMFKALNDLPVYLTILNKYNKLGTNI
jgi:hypothetical protein